MRRFRKTELSDEEKLHQWESNVYRLCLLHGEWDSVDFLYPRVGNTVSALEMQIMTKEARKIQAAKRGGPMEEIVLSNETLAMVERRSSQGCVCCGYILSDFKVNGKLTDYPGNYPVEAKVEHVSEEKEGRVA